MSSKSRLSRTKTLFLAIIFCFVGLGAYSMTATMPGVYCKDCGSETNCWQGSGLDEGYQDCYIDENGDCHVNFYGGCEAYPDEPEDDEG